MMCSPPLRRRGKLAEFLADPAGGVLSKDETFNRNYDQEHGRSEVAA